MNAAQHKKAMEIVNNLQGTCQSLSDVYKGDDMEILETIDEHLFLCECCGWWCEQGDWSTIEEEAEENYCSHCEGNMEP